LDLAQNANKSLVIFVHGGGWGSGDKSIARVFASTLIDAGYAVATINYRLTPAVTLDIAAGDVADAVDYLAKNEDQRRFDSRRIAVMGHSAGAHLVALAATRARLSPSVKVIILLDGIGYDLKRQLDLQPGLVNRAGISSGSLDAISPISNLGTVPKSLVFWIAAGDDRRQTREQGQEFAQQLTAKGVSAHFSYYSGAEHSSFIRNLRDPSAPLTRDILSLLASHLRPR